MLSFLNKNNRILKKSIKLDWTDKSLGELALKAKGYKEEGFNESKLPEYIELINQVTTKVLDKTPYDVQVLGGLTLHESKVIEMKTGEGKTLTVLLPVYLSYLQGQVVHIATTNEYLASRDASELKPVYNTLGLSVETNLKSLSLSEKREVYESDIIYGTLTEFGFDYLRDNRAPDPSQTTGFKTGYLIVDEADSVLIDSSKTPLIISGESEMNPQLWKFVKTAYKQFKRGADVDDSEETTSESFKKRESSGDYSVEPLKKSVIIHSSGYDKFDELFKKMVTVHDKAQNGVIHQILTHYLSQYIYAKDLMKRDVDYAVKNREVILIDTYTGRLLIGQQFSDGLHQALEVKENIPPQGESQTYASITFPELIKLYPKLSGMSGTAIDGRKEFEEFYNLNVEEIKTHKPTVRVDHETKLFITKENKLEYFLNLVERMHEEGRPILIGTTSVEQSQDISRKLRRKGLKHNLLNALNDENESYIIAQAGMYKAITLSTNMAGRGTDILLGGNAEMMIKEKVLASEFEELDVYNLTPTDNADLIKLQEEFKENQKKCALEKEKIIDLGGLFVIGYEQNESSRIDNQLRGRAGRQGEPGESVILSSLDDDVFKRFPSLNIDRFKELHENETEIKSKTTRRVFKRTQKELEIMSYNQRKDLFEYDEVNTIYRNSYYSLRKDLLNSRLEFLVESWNTFIDEQFEEFKGEVANSDEQTTYYLENLSNVPLEKIRSNGLNLIDENFAAFALNSIDNVYSRLLTSFQNIKDASKNSQFSQEKPIDFYRNECYDEFSEFMVVIGKEASKLLLYIVNQNMKGES